DAAVVGSNDSRVYAVADEGAQFTAPEGTDTGEPSPSDGTTSGDGPGFGVPAALAGLGAGAWGLRSAGGSGPDDSGADGE
ncbi:hypothetical protein BRD17_10010, partial [Halobacteriales archaeon SW_7_68_16]